MRQFSSLQTRFNEVANSSRGPNFPDLIDAMLREPYDPSLDCFRWLDQVLACAQREAEWRHGEEVARAEKQYTRDMLAGKTQRPVPRSTDPVPEYYRDEDGRLVVILDNGEHFTVQADETEHQT